MCGGGSCAGDLIYMTEKLVTYLSFTAVILCIVITICISIGVGAGIGYNYCFVDLSAKTPNSKPPAPDLLRSRSKNNDNYMPDARRSQPERTGDERREAPPPVTLQSTIAPTEDDKYTLTLNLNDDLDFSALITRLRAQRHNATLNLIT